jgi:hypothetical protein
VGYNTGASSVGDVLIRLRATKITLTKDQLANRTIGANKAPTLGDKGLREAPDIYVCERLIIREKRMCKDWDIYILACI